jgi:hypothetical protein
VSRVAHLLGAGLAAAALTACVDAEDTMPRCRPDDRLAIVAQSTPAASHVPCVAELPAGWSFTDLAVADTGTRFALRSDRAEQPVVVRLQDDCEVRDAVPVPPRADGVRTYQHLEGIDPAYAGTLFDVFPGGCITYRFSFERGPHIALMDDLDRALQLYPRRQLRQELRDADGPDLG